MDYTVVGNFVLVKAFDGTEDEYAIQINNIITIMPVRFAKVGTNGTKYYMQFHTMLGGRILMRTEYATKAAAVADRLVILAALSA